MHTCVMPVSVTNYKPIIQVLNGYFILLMCKTWTKHAIFCILMWPFLSHDKLYIFLWTSWTVTVFSVNYYCTWLCTANTPCSWTLAEQLFCFYNTAGCNARDFQNKTGLNHSCFKSRLKREYKQFCSAGCPSAAIGFGWKFLRLRSTIETLILL